MTQPIVEKVAIIGSGPAGWTAAIYAARAGLRPILFEGALTMENQEAGMLPMGQLTTTSYVENYPGFPAGDLRGYLNSAISEERSYSLPVDTFDDEAATKGVSGPALVELMRSQAENFGVRIVSEDVVEVNLERRPFTLRDSNGDETLATTVIVATGASTRWLGLPSEERFRNNGVGACAVCDGALPRFRDKTIVVVGGGDSALEDALYLTKFGSKIIVIHRRDEFRASKILVKRAEENPKIEVLWNSKIVEILGDDDAGVTGVRVKNLKDETEETLDYDAAGVFVAIGRRPNVDFLRGALELDEAGCVKRVTAFRSDTSVKGVFVAGDVADSRYRQAIVAAASGAMAAIDAERFILESGC